MEGISKVVIKKTAEGYGVYDRPYWYYGRRIEGLHFTAKTIEECAEFCKKENLDYEIEE